MTREIENLLIVDDHPDNLRVLATILTQQGYKVRKALSGTTALETIQVLVPDLILLDIEMPHMNGFQVCSALKATAQTREIPVIFLSGMDNVADKVKAFAVGGADYITKPFQAEEVLARVQHQLTLQQQKRQLQQEIYERSQVELALREANQKLQRLVNSDGLTQIANRRYFDESLQQEWKRLRREQALLSLILCDIDFFKAYNDRYGHLAGDDCLKQVAQAIQQSVHRPADLVARYGGEEFVVILPNTSIKGAAVVAAQMQTAIAELQILHAGSTISPFVTLSIGIACTIPELHKTPESLILIADQALYSAKASGRNTCCQSSNVEQKAIPAPAW
ncbi:MAG: PleD family two-component system response regulator [Leptolyngbyaceae cyanobacterium bins.302]|nr:PleD family two-component system response regulator [Leptolyngbyaceae cyanobacterium bins.302]